MQLRLRKDQNETTLIANITRYHEVDKKETNYLKVTSVKFQVQGAGTKISQIK